MQSDKETGQLMPLQFIKVITLVSSLESPLLITTELATKLTNENRRYNDDQL